MRRWLYLGVAAIAVVEIVAPRFYSDEAHFWFENLPAWGSVYGLLSCVAIILVSKLLGKAWLMRRENYYDS